VYARTIAMPQGIDGRRRADPLRVGVVVELEVNHRLENEGGCAIAQTVAGLFQE
jgi:hypothetical protein